MKKYIIVILAFTLLTQCTKKTEISQWRGPNRDGVYLESNLLKEWPENGPELIWKFDELGSGYSSAAVLEDFVFTVGTVDSISYVFKFDHSGNLVFRKELGPEWMTTFPGMNSTPLLYNGLGYILGGLGDLYCFDLNNGDIIWKENLITDYEGVNNTYGITENLIIEGDKLFCTPGGKEHNIIALNRFNGELIWTCSGNGEGSNYGSPIIVEVAEEKYMIMTTDSSLLSVNTNNGELTWKYNLGSGNHNVPYYRDGNLFVMGVKPEGALKLKISANGKSVSKIWHSEFVNVGMGDAVVLGEKIYGANWKKRSVYCIDWNTGEAIDSVKISRMSTLIAADEMIYSYEFQGDFSLLQHNEKEFKTVSTFKVEGGIKNQHCAHPVIQNGRLYVRHDNSLFVYNISNS